MTALVRPEHLSLTTDTGAEGVLVTVVSSGFFGAHRRTLVRLEDGSLVTVQHGTREHFEPDVSATLRYLGEAVAVQAT